MNLQDQPKKLGTETAKANRKVNYGKPYFAIALAAFTSLGGWFFGYDQGVTGGIVVMKSFKNDFCIGIFGNTSECYRSISGLPSGYRRFVVLFSLLYNIGCFIGAVFISSFVAEKFGRRAIIFTASALFLAGTSMVIFPPGGSISMIVLILVGRVIEGTGVGCSSFSCPLYASEIAPTNIRGMLSGFMQMTVVTGLFAANIVNLFLKEHKWGWRLSNGVILIAPITIMIGIFFCPESPRWLFKKKNRTQAEQSLKRIRKIDDVSAELDAIGEAIEHEGTQISLKALLTTKKLLHRLGIGVGIHILQQATGINPIFTYGGIIFEGILGKGIISLLLLSGANLLSTIPALFLFDRLGRRKLLLICGLAMVLGHLAAATVFVSGCSLEKIVVNGIETDEEKVSCRGGSGIVMLICTIIFVAFFAISWGPIAWIYAAEIFPLNVRARAVAITTGSNWFMGTIMTYILELVEPLGYHGVFYLFSGLTLVAVVFVYMFCPETGGVLLEDIENVFNNFKFRNRTVVRTLVRAHRKRTRTAPSTNVIELN